MKRTMEFKKGEACLLIVTNPFVNTETQPYQLNAINQNVKLDHSTLTAQVLSGRNFEAGYQLLMIPKNSKKIIKARPLIYIRRLKAF